MSQFVLAVQGTWFLAVEYVRAWARGQPVEPDYDAAINEFKRRALESPPVLEINQAIEFLLSYGYRVRMGRITHVIDYKHDQ